jgi:hypothetical protein
MIYEVSWLDATGHSNIELSKFLKPPYKRHLSKRKTLGIKIYKDKDCVIVVSDITDDQEQGDITVIPRHWLIKIRKIKDV